MERSQPQHRSRERRYWFWRTLPQQRRSLNVADGYLALNNNADGAGNAATGAQALLRNTTGIGNTATGRNEFTFSAGDLNAAIGYSAGGAITTAPNVICIGANVAGADMTTAAT